MPSIRLQMQEWIRANRKEKDMTAETLERLYDVMLEMEALLENHDVKTVSVERVEKWFHLLQFSIIKELTGKNEVVVIKEEELSNAIKTRLIEEGNQSKRSGNDG